MCSYAVISEIKSAKYNQKWSWINADDLCTGDNKNHKLLYNTSIENIYTELGY